MVTFNSLNSLIDDIVLEIRNGDVSASDTLSRLQIEQWIHYYRALLIKQDIDKGRDINPAYLQSLDGVRLLKEDYGKNGQLRTDKYRHITEIEIPKTIDLHFKSGIVSVTDVFGNPIQVTSEQRAVWQRDRRWTCNDYLAYLKNNHMYVEGPKLLEYINIKLLAEDPTKIANEVKDDGTKCYNANLPYPVPANMIPVIKQMIMEKELGIMITMPSDTKNNISNDLENITVKK